MIVATLISLFGLLLLSVPVAAVMGLTAVILSGMYSFIPATRGVATIGWQSMNDAVLVAVPLFVLMGEILLRSGVASRMYGALSGWLVWLPGGLMHANIATSTMFAADHDLGLGQAKRAVGQTAMICQGANAASAIAHAVRLKHQGHQAHAQIHETARAKPLVDGDDDADRGVEKGVVSGELRLPSGKVAPLDAKGAIQRMARRMLPRAQDRRHQLGKIAVFAGLGRLMRHAGQGVAQQGQRFLGQDMKAAGLQVRTAWRPSRR